MQKEVISDKQGIILIMMFMVGSAILLIPGQQAKRDIWIALLLVTLITLPVVLMYARLLYLFPGCDLFDILQNIFGETIGKIVSVLFIWFAFHLGALVLWNFGSFIHTVGLVFTPLIVTMGCITLLSAWAIKEGIEVLGRWGEFFLPILIISFTLIFFLLIPKMEISHIKPVLYDGIKPVLKGMLSLFSFPFAETVIFTAIFNSLKTRKSIYRVYTTGVTLSGIIGTIVSLSVVLILGINYSSTTYFPSYAGITRVAVGNFLERLEIIIAVIFLAAGFVKVSICMLVACRGVTKVFGFKDYRFIVTPIALLMLNLSNFVYESVQESVEWAVETWPYYAFLFQVILPVIIFIAAEIKARRNHA